MYKLQQAISGQTVQVTWAEVGMNYETRTGFMSLADLQNWAVTFGLQVTTLVSGGVTYYQISKQ